MKLLVKFSVVFVLVFGLGLGAAASVFYSELRETAREQVLHQARIMMETALATRSYTTELVRPALNDASQREQESAATFRDLCLRRAAIRAASVRAQEAAAKPAPPAPDTGTTLASVREEPPDPFRDACASRGLPARVFRPQTVPAFAATEVFGYVGKKYPEYVYKEATLNPTNPRDRAVDWEEDIIKAFRNQPDLDMLDGERTSPLGRSFFLARPLRAGKSCLECHSTPAAAPPEMVALYGTANGFGWKENEVIAAQIVSVPVSVSAAMADRVYRRLLGSLVLVAVLTLVLLNVVLFFTVIRPISRFAAMADEISKGRLDEPELPVTGRDEISVLAESFNRMRRSLAAAMKMLDQG